MSGDPFEVGIPSTALVLTTYAPSSSGTDVIIIPAGALVLTTYAMPGSFTVWDKQSVRVPDAVVWDLATFDRPPT